MVFTTCSTDSRPVQPGPLASLVVSQKDFRLLEAGQSDTLMLLLALPVHLFATQQPTL